MEKSEAVTEHKIRCGICKELKLVCAADRNNEGKIKYFKRKHYDKCLANGTTSLKPKVVGQMQQFMKAFFGKQSPENTDTPTQDIDTELDPDLSIILDTESNTMLDTSTEHFADIDLIEEGDIFDDEETDDVSFGCVVCSEIETDLSIPHDSDDNFKLRSPHENEPDKLALSLQDVINQKKLTPDCFMYKFLDKCI
ncbi:uncharacterized protein LOC127710411 [Mytilus californianus]|uniref:uncharacterized protein LOC127710411 n=1 Tax=Mytilus californianus TaxID=6549 RepID=UPI0022482803|nr:uncharacterized protein LOC127710411 [Mytilus californianus]